MFHQYCSAICGLLSGTFNEQDKQTKILFHCRDYQKFWEIEKWPKFRGKKKNNNIDQHLEDSIMSRTFLLEKRRSNN